MLSKKKSPIEGAKNALTHGEARVEDGMQMSTKSSHFMKN